jgi:hypothetical protein
VAGVVLIVIASLLRMPRAGLFLGGVGAGLCLAALSVTVMLGATTTKES